ncbi:MAG: sodium ion-translocating decarboxylase subunit beta [Clostridia bacterium]|nr:sodium ion-translocating decarboxylase subunit beta [Clostridia bacterium]
MWDAIQSFYEKTGLVQLIENPELGWKTLAMYVIVGILFYLGIVKKFEPLLLIPIATGMLLANLPGTGMFHMEWFIDGVEVYDPQLGEMVVSEKMRDIVAVAVSEGGLIDILYLGVKLGVYPSLIFMGVGAMTDFSALIANPKSLLLGAAAQLGVFVAFMGALLLGFGPAAAAAIGIIGGADGPTAILVTKILAPSLLGAIAIAAYSYMALIPMIQPPLMKLVTTKKERQIVMTNLRPVSKLEKVLFPILVTIIVVLLVPDAAPLVGFLMFGNLLNVCGVTERLSKTSQNELINIITIMLGVSVGATANAANFLAWDTIKIIILGLVAFAVSTLGGLLFGKLMCFLTKGKINPLIGSAGVSAVPMAARVAQDVGRKENPANFLLMHAMGPNVAGVIGSAVAAGVFLQLFQQV